MCLGPGTSAGDCKCGLAKRVSRIVGGRYQQLNIIYVDIHMYVKCCGDLQSQALAENIFLDKSEKFF